MNSESESPQPETHQTDTSQPVTAEVSVQVKETAISAEIVAKTGKRQAFSNIRRQLSEEDLKTVGVQKMILEELERAEAQCEVAEGFRDRFHEADKAAAILREKLKTETSIDVFFTVGLASGGAIIGLAPYFWDNKSTGPLALVVGAVLLIGSLVGRAIRLWPGDRR